MGYSRQAFIGVSWVALLRFTTRLLSLGRILVIARIFTPKEFGLYGIASLVIALLEILVETGVNIIFVQEKNSIRKFLNTAWVVSIIRGILISVVILILAPFIASFFNDPSLLILILLISIVPFIRGFINPAIIIYQKELQFKNEFYFRFFIFFVESMIIIIVSLMTHSIYSLIAGLIVGALLEVILSFIVIRQKPKFQFQADLVKEVIEKGKWVTAGGIFNYLFHNIDDIFVGKILGTVSLGFYQMAYKISILPITEIADVLAKVTFPLYAKIADDRERLKKAFFKTLAVVSAFSLLFGFILINFTEEIVVLVLGEKWISIIPFLKILTIFGVIRGISGLTSTLFLAIKKQEYVSIVTFASFLILATIIIPFIDSAGLIGASFAVLIASVAVLPIMVYFTHKALYA